MTCQGVRLTIADGIKSLHVFLAILYSSTASSSTSQSPLAVGFMFTAAEDKEHHVEVMSYVTWPDCYAMHGTRNMNLAAELR